MQSGWRAVVHSCAPSYRAVSPVSLPIAPLVHFGAGTGECRLLVRLVCSLMGK